MATAHLRGGGRFPAGTTVEAYLPEQFPGGSLTATPTGAAHASAVVQADDSLTLTGLVEVTEYVATAIVGLLRVSSRFRTPAVTPGFSIGTVEAGAEADASITGEPPTQQLNLVLPAGEQGVPGAPGTPGEPGAPGLTGVSTATMTISGTQKMRVGTVRLPIAKASTLLSVMAMAGSAPTGAALIVDVHLSGTTIFTTQANRPEIAVGTQASAEETPDVTAAAAGSYLTVDVDQVGSTLPGDDVTVLVRYRENA